jgi:hypothetical protein
MQKVNQEIDLLDKSQTGPEFAELCAVSADRQVVNSCFLV